MSQPKQRPEGISVKTTAELLEVSEMTVRRWIRLGFLEAVRVGPWLIRIPVTEIARLRKIRVEASDNATIPRYPKV
jgi:excisionase family DNA binding protein